MGCFSGAMKQDSGTFCDGDWDVRICAPFETARGDIFTYSNGEVPGSPPRTISVGVVTGTIQTFGSRSRLRFSIYDSVHNRGVQCYLDPGREELVRELWGRRASVSGTIHRDRVTGIPKSVTNILKIDPLPDREPGSYKNARGAVPWKEGDRNPEDVIRKLRDAW